ncbi:hypothetical protein XPN_0402, partial [Xanthomonas arboricola pv. pruni MAFF 301427]
RFRLTTPFCRAGRPHWPACDRHA